MDRHRLTPRQARLANLLLPRPYPLSWQAGSHVNMEQLVAFLDAALDVVEWKQRLGDVPKSQDEEPVGGA